jgi:hypothetical protein
MITGYPHKRASMLEVACGLVEKRLARPVLSIVSLGGFPAPRAEKVSQDEGCLASIRNISSFNSGLLTRSVIAKGREC